ncbi:MAG: GMC family oxidoreductase N-terminal domain-containing protein [Gammaproteobacteria bacterium]
MTNAEADKNFDYIVIGSGTAGCVLANRLSEDRDVSVCMIEAGPPDKSPRIHIPAAVATLLFDKKMGWGYKTVPQKNLDGRVIPIPRGKVLGGCSSTNGMVYYRGHPKDYDDWAAAGNTGWSFAEVLPYFIRSENNITLGDSPWHGSNGPMQVSDVNRLNPLIDTFLEATDELGYPRCEDFNGTLEPEGFNSRQGTIHNGRRVSGVTAFIDPVKFRKNLTIMTDSLVTRILLQKKRAQGVEVNVGGEIRKLKANREVILAGGAFGSPQILMLSGIGAGGELRDLGIKVQHDLPAVGKNLHDHPAIGILYHMKTTESYGLSWRALPRDMWNLTEYLLFRQGPLASNLFEAMGFLRTEEGLDRPDVQFVFQPAARNKKFSPVPIGHGYAMNPVCLYPRSRGTVSLAGPDPHAKPLLDPNVLDDERDIQALVRAIRICREILNASAFEATGGAEYAPDPDVNDDEGLKDYVRRNVVTVHHPVSTCRMGADEDSVVDPELRVRGVKGLRVADASVFPSLIGGNTNAAVVMVAEKAADMIRGRPAPEPMDPNNL